VAGINRVSLGVQTFEPELLQVCGRSHTLDDIWAAFDLIHQAGVKNFSLDLISGLPHQSLEQWQASLETAVAIAPHHISIYDLTLSLVLPSVVIINQDLIHYLQMTPQYRCTAKECKSSLLLVTTL
jgi:coproporphyrinogen III oxidase-like Fe-S oxidoreductase